MREVNPTPVPGLDLRGECGHHQSPAIRAGGMVFCSGMVAIDPHNSERKHGTVTSEARRIFENLKLLLEPAGSSLDRIVQVHAMIYDRIEYDVVGLIGGGYAEAEWLNGEFAAAGNHRIGCGFITWAMARRPAVLDEALQRTPAAVMLSFGDAAPFIPRIKRAGALVICQADDGHRRARDHEGDGVPIEGGSRQPLFMPEDKHRRRY
jgi:enamine deaminase RidA (YjgF/YER057c/UK114 family)